MVTRNIRLQRKDSTNNGNRAAIASNLLLIIGTCIILAALIYMIINLHEADSIITIWLLFIGAGLYLSLMGSFMKMWFNKGINPPLAKRKRLL